MRRWMPSLMIAALLVAPLGASQAHAKSGGSRSGPVVQRLSAYFSPVAGGVPVTITGTGFTGAAKVLFGDKEAKFTVVSRSTIVTTAPAHLSGRVHVRIVGTSTSITSSADEFAYYQEAPRTASVTVKSHIPVICIVGSSCIGVAAVTSGFETARQTVSCRVTNSSSGPLGQMWTQGAAATYPSGVTFSGSWVEVTCDGVVGRNTSWPAG